MYTEYLRMLEIPTTIHKEMEFLKYPVLDNSTNLIDSYFARYGMKHPSEMVTPYITSLSTGVFFTNEVYIKYYSDFVTLLKYHIIDLLSLNDFNVSDSPLLLQFRLDFPSVFSLIEGNVENLNSFLIGHKSEIKDDILKLACLVNSEEICGDILAIANKMDKYIPLGARSVRVSLEDFDDYVIDNKVLLRYRLKSINVTITDDDYRCIGYSPMCSSLVGLHNISSIRYLTKGESLLTTTLETKPDTPILDFIPNIIDYLNTQNFDNTQMLVASLNLKLSKNKVPVKIRRFSEVIILSEYICKIVEENIRCTNLSDLFVH